MKRVICLSVVALFAMVVTASAGFNFTTGSVRGGYIAPEDPLESTYGVGADVGLGVPVPYVNLAIEANYWNKSYNDPIFTTWELKYTDFNVGISGKYEIAAAPNTFYPYVGAGFGVHFLSTSVDIGLGSISASDTKFGAHAFGGFRVPVSPVVSFFAEGRYTWVSPDYFGAHGGITYSFGK